MKPLYKKYVKNNILVVAHRGDQTNAPENSLKAFQDAVNVGADMIETDIHITKDKKIVIFHNNYIDIGAKKKLIEDLTYSELAKQKIIDTKTNQTVEIIELKDLFDLSEGKCYLNIEIKKNMTIPDSQYIDILLEYVCKHGDFNQIIFASFYYDLLKEIKSKNPEVPLAAIRIPRHPVLPEVLVDSIGIDAYITSLSSLKKEITGSIEKSGIVLGAYSIDNQKHFDKAMKYNVKAIGSNQAAKIVKIAENYRRNMLLQQ